METMKILYLYSSYRTAMEKLTDAALGRLVKAMLAYTFDGTVPQLTGKTELVFDMIRQQIDRDREKYASVCMRNRKNGAKGGRPKTLENPVKPGQTQNDPVKPQKAKEKENEKDKEKEKEKEKEKDNKKEKESVCMAQPGDPAEETTHTQLCVSDIQKYCLEQGLTYVDPERFFDHYRSVGWMSGNHKITDWQAALRIWNREDAAKAAANQKKEDKYAIYDELCQTQFG